MKFCSIFAWYVVKLSGILWYHDVGVKSPQLWCLRIVPCIALPQSSPVFAYRGIIILFLCLRSASVGAKRTSTGCSAPYRGGFQGLSSTYEQAHVDLDLLTPGIIVLSFCNHLHFAVCSIFFSSIYLLICPHTHIIFPVLFQFFEDNTCFSGTQFFRLSEFFIIRIADLITICLFYFLLQYIYG